MIAVNDTGYIMPLDGITGYIQAVVKKIDGDKLVCHTDQGDIEIYRDWFSKVYIFGAPIWKKL